MLQAARVHHLCCSVDYKREVLEILLNSKELLIMPSAFIHLSDVVCHVTCMLKKRVSWRVSFMVLYVHSRECDL